MYHNVYIRWTRAHLYLKKNIETQRDTKRKRERERMKYVLTKRFEFA